MKDAQDARYEEAAAAFGPALQRLAAAIEADRDKRRDLLQDIHVALWRSLAAFDGRCALSTWIYRVAHNVAADHVAQARRVGPLLALEEIAEPPAAADLAAETETRDALARIHALLRTLKPPDGLVMTLYLEGLDAAAIGEIAGLSPGAVAVRIHRVKALLAKLLREPAHAD